MLPSGLEEFMSTWYDGSFQKWKHSERCSEDISVQSNFHQLVLLYEASWGHSYYRLWRLLKTLFALLRYWKCTGSFTKYSISAYCFSNILGHIVELQFSMPSSHSIKPWKCFTHLHTSPAPSKTAFWTEAPREAGISELSKWLMRNTCIG